MSDDINWWNRATLRYRQLVKAKGALQRVTAAIEAHADCWPDCPCVELAADIRRALDGTA